MKAYEMPVVDLLLLGNEDVITTSNDQYLDDIFTPSDGSEEVFLPT